MAGNVFVLILVLVTQVTVRQEAGLISTHLKNDLLPASGSPSWNAPNNEEHAEMLPFDLRKLVSRDVVRRKVAQPLIHCKPFCVGKSLPTTNWCTIIPVVTPYKAIRDPRSRSHIFLCPSTSGGSGWRFDDIGIPARTQSIAEFSALPV